MPGPGAADPEQGSAGDPGIPVVIAGVIAIAAAVALLAPLGHPDLPSHLRIGEWILDRRAVPFEEPIAWTRAGAPYYAYSWLPQATFAAAWRAAGAAGVHVMSALITVAAGAALLLLAAAERWSRRTGAAMLALHLAALGLTVPSLRPQAMLFVALPLAAAGAAYLGRSMTGRGAALAFAGSALAANSHLFFPLTLAPAAWSLARGAPARTIVLFAAAVGAGWLASPYALHWVEVYRLNLGSNPLLGAGSPIPELAAGFAALHPRALATVAVGAWLAMLGGRELDARGRIAAMAVVALAAGMYGFAVRLAVPTWLTLLPFAAVGMRRLAARRPASAAGVAGVLLAASLVAPARWAGWSDAGFGAPGVAAPYDRRIGPGARALRCAVPRLRGSRVFTRFEEGSYLAWALAPALVSVDTRTIYPDSVAFPERAVLRGRDVEALGPWRSADVIVIAADDPAVGAVEGDERFLPFAESGGGEARSYAWWVRRSWWSTESRDDPSFGTPPAAAIDPRRAPCRDLASGRR